MSIAERDTRAVVVYYVSDTGRREYPITFRYLEDARNLSVYLRKTSDGTLRQLVYPTEYEVSDNPSGENEIWDSVQLDASLSLETGDKIAISRSIPVDQETTFSAQTVFSTTMDMAIDKLTAIVQDMQFLPNTIHAPIDEDVTEQTLSLGTAEERANKLLGFVRSEANNSNKTKYIGIVGNYSRYISAQLQVI